MYELIRISNTCCYMDAPAKVGFVTEDGGKVVLIDSGNDKDAGKKDLATSARQRLGAVCHLQYPFPCRSYWR